VRAVVAEQAGLVVREFTEKLASATGAAVVILGTMLQHHSDIHK
jgi:hypothetical protein